MSDAVNSDLIKALFRANRCPPLDIYQEMLGAVLDVIPCEMAILWKVNNAAGSISAYAQHNFRDLSTHESWGVYRFGDNAYCDILGASRAGNRFLLFENVERELDLSKLPASSRIGELGLKRMVAICIPALDLNGVSEDKSSDSAEDKEVVDCVLELYLQEGIGPDTLEIIRDFLSLAFARARLLAREHLEDDVRSIYEAKGQKDIGSVLHPLVNQVVKKYIQYEGCSVFMWDEFDLLLRLVSTTGLEGTSRRADVYYQLGEGLTGTVAKWKKIQLIPDLRHVDNPKLAMNKLYKWKERTASEGKSFMAVPIVSPSSPDDILGVIRFTNRLNPLSGSIDYFSQEDVDLVLQAVNLITLYMEHDHAERERAAYALQMAHEVNHPAFSIRGTSDRLRNRIFTSRFPAAKALDYIESIYNNAELQIAWVDTIEQAFHRGKESRASRYSVEEVSIRTVVVAAQKLVISQARDEGLRFDKIGIIGRWPVVYVDPKKFEHIFFNFLTNAIKYRNYDDPLSFKVEIEGYGFGQYQVPETRTVQMAQERTSMNVRERSGYLICVRDWGMGVVPEEAEKIFNFGFRNKRVIKFNVRGLGIGMAVIDRIVKDFDGWVWLAHHKDPTEFRIFLPARVSSTEYLSGEDWNNEVPGI